MKTASRLIATLRDQPAERLPAPAVVPMETAEAVNELFRRLRGIFPAWRQAWPSTQALAAAKEEWIKEFAAQGIHTFAQIELGLSKCRKLTKPFAPSVGEFVAMCEPAPQDFGMPGPADAWFEALMARYSHQAVRIAARATGIFDLTHARHDDQALRARFERNYHIVLRRAQAGQPLDGAIPAGIGHDGQKTELERADELAARRARARIIEQGIPADGESARALLLSRFGQSRRQVAHCAQMKGKEG